MKEFVIFYLGDNSVIYEAETKHVPVEGEWVRIGAETYVAAKIHYIYSVAEDRHEANILLAPLSKAWLKKLMGEE